MIRKFKKYFNSKHSKHPYDISYFKFLQDLNNKCKKSNCVIDIRNSENYVNNGGPGGKCVGFFDPDNKLIRTINIFKNLKENGDILIHESCHLDQYLENCLVWRKSFINGEDTTIMFDEWIDGKRKFTDNQIKNIVKKITDIELDCEKRAVNKLKKYKFPYKIISKYIQCANSYILSYYISMHLRKKLKVAPFSEPKVWKKMPKIFIKTPEKNYIKYKELFEKYCF